MQIDKFYLVQYNIEDSLSTQSVTAFTEEDEAIEFCKRDSRYWISEEFTADL